MLDLASVNNKYYEVKLIDGTLLKLKRPTQAMQNSLLTLKDAGSENAINSMLALFIRIINRNTENKIFTSDDFEDYDIALTTLVIKDYFEFWSKEVMQLVNFQQPQEK